MRQIQIQNKIGQVDSTEKYSFPNHQMGAVEPAQVMSLSWRPQWEVVVLLVALALAQVDVEDDVDDGVEVDGVNHDLGDLLPLPTHRPQALHPRRPQSLPPGHHPLFSGKMVVYDYTISVIFTYTYQAFSSVIFTYTPNPLHLTAAAMVVCGNLAFFWKPVLSSEDLK